VIAPLDFVRLRYPKFEKLYEKVVGFLMRESEKVKFEYSYYTPPLLADSSILAHDQWRDMVHHRCQLCAYFLSARRGHSCYPDVCDFYFSAIRTTKLMVCPSIQPFLGRYRCLNHRPSVGLTHTKASDALARPASALGTTQESRRFPCCDCNGRIYCDRFLGPSRSNATRSTDVGLGEQWRLARPSSCWLGCWHSQWHRRSS
jgi:hypothetical protein